MGIRENSDAPINTRKKSVRNSISVHFRRREMSLTEETGRRISQTTSSRFTAPFIPRRASRDSGSVFTDLDENKSVGTRRSTVSNKFKGIVRTHLMAQRMNSTAMSFRFKSLLRGYTMSKLTGDGRTFSGLPMSFYVPEYKARESFENSYQLAPPVKFDVQNVKPHIQKIVTLFAMGEYAPATAKNNVTAMCDRVREELKRFNYRRYRYVVSGFVTKADGQGISVASRSITDPVYDRFLQCAVKRKDCYTLCTIHAIYLE